MTPSRYATFAQVPFPQSKKKKTSGYKKTIKTKTLTVYAYALYLFCDPEAYEEFSEKIPRRLDPNREPNKVPRP